MHLGLIGYGNIARGVIAGLKAPDAPPVSRLTLLVRKGRAADAGEALKGAFAEATVVETLDALVAAAPDLVAECAGQGAVRDHVPALLRAGIDVIAASIGALADAGLHRALHEAATAGGARLILPPGAVGGVDILAALRHGGAVSVSYRGTKPPAAWAGTPAESLVDLKGLSQAEVFFSGTARDAASQYPKNANVAATLALAGAGFEATSVELVADPRAPGNLHEFTVRSDAATVSVRIEGRASAGNAKTSQATIYSILRAIGNHSGPLVI